ncbi:MAG: hypothetical protein N0A00_01575 [Candidatus Bathyarchaeota archaeon]|nr:hypothetical protein [Candidatus Bathyarchaeota archaeon]
MEAWRGGYASKYGIDAVSYKGKIYNPYADVAEMLIKAVEENVKPEVLATVNL